MTRQRFDSAYNSYYHDVAHGIGTTTCERRLHPKCSNFSLDTKDLAVRIYYICPIGSTDMTQCEFDNSTALAQSHKRDPMTN